MSAGNDRFNQLALWIVPTSIVMVGCGVRLLPHHMVMHLAEFVIAWLTVSVPVGVFTGHCMLGECDVC